MSWKLGAGSWKLGTGSWLFRHAQAGRASVPRRRHPVSDDQINLDFTLDSTTIPLRLRQIDPSCLPAAEDSCQNLYDATMPPRPAGVLRFGNALQPYGTRTRIVLQNMSPSETVRYSVTITPFRGGCT